MKKTVRAVTVYHRHIQTLVYFSILLISAHPPKVQAFHPPLEVASYAPSIPETDYPYKEKSLVHPS